MPLFWYYFAHFLHTILNCFNIFASQSREVMGKEKLFRTAEELIDGYGLRSVKDSNGKRKVYLIGRILPSGNVSIIRYSCYDYNIKRVSTGKILIPENTLNDKTHNKEILRLQTVECDTLNSDLERKEANFAPVTKKSINVIDYTESMSKKALAETGNRNSNYATFHSLSSHIARCFGNNVPFKDINKVWIQRFLEYLRNEAVNLNYVRTPDLERRRLIPLTENSQLRLFRNLNSVLSQAKREGIIQSNPCELIERIDKPKEKKGRRTYLELEEVHRLISTPFPHTASTADYRNAFLFACCTGLRYSDLRTLTASQIKESENGIFIDLTQRKTGEDLKIYLDDFALSLIPKRDENPDLPVFKLPKNSNANDNVAFKTWFKNANITKHITWHCARHTTATIMLSNEIPLAVVSKQLGHTKLSTTQIYAKIVDKAQAEAAKKLSNLLVNI